MANIALDTADRIEVVESLIQATLVAAEAIAAGAPVRIDTTGGTFTNANATGADEARAYGIAAKSVGPGEAVTAIRVGVLDGFDLSGLDYDQDVYLSDTDGRLADAAGTVNRKVGRVVPGTAQVLGDSPDKLLYVDMRGAVEPSVDTLSITDADGLAVNGEIIPTRTIVTVSCPLNTDCVDQAFFIADRSYIVERVDEVHAVAGDHASAVNLQVTKDTGTNAPGAGSDLLTNNSNAGFNLKATANTVQNGTLVSTGATKTLAGGDRLSLDFAGDTQNLAGLVVTVALRAV